MTLPQLNRLSRDEFTRLVGPVFEHSPWIAEAAWANRPFATVEALHAVMCDIVRTAGEEKQLALIRAHPDLVVARPPSPLSLGRDEASRPLNAPLVGQLTKESTSEQASAGLNRLTPEESEAFHANNAAYRTKFGFPFIICARLNKKQAILDGFTVRLNNSREQEIQTALAEIAKIAWLRLNDLIEK